MTKVRFALIAVVLVAIGLCGWFVYGRYHKVPSNRLSYDDSCRHLQQLSYLRPNEFPPMPARCPLSGDEVPLGLSFFRTLVGDADLDNLSIPRTFFGRSEIRSTTFRNTDLSESCLCWNDFVEVDFSDAVLAGSDLRASNYDRVKFTRSDLRKADFRRSTFVGCDFAGALLNGAKLDRENKLLGILSEQQRAVIDYQPEGDDPPGG